MPDVPGALPRHQHRGWRESPLAVHGLPPGRGRQVIETPRLVLRELAVDDAPFILRLFNDPSFLRHIGDRGVRDLEGAQRYIGCGMVGSYRRHGFGLWRVELREDGDLPIGICGLVARPTLPAPDIGFAFRPAWWSCGYAFEAAAAVMAHARRALGLSLVLAIASPRNHRSLRLLHKLGFRYERELSMRSEAEPMALLRRDADL